MRYKKISFVFLALAIVGAVVCFFQIRKEPISPTVSTVPPQAILTSGLDNRVISDTSYGLKAAQSVALVEDKNRIGLFNQPVRSLMRSNNIAKVDYARFRVSTQCISLTHGENATKIVEDSALAESKLTNTELLSFGRATLENRLRALSSSKRECSKLYEGALLSVDENMAINAQPEIAEWRSILKTAMRQPFDPNLPETKAAIEKIMSGPMFGGLEALLNAKLSGEELTQAYSPQQAAAIQNFVVPILLCQMGDDCRSGGIVADQLCWQSGICGETVEVAILDHLRSHQIDPAALVHYITTIRSAIEKRDLSIFRRAN